MKKGSLNLSINAIIVIVIAFVFLGLAVTFVQSQIGDAGGTVTEVQDSIKEQILSDLQQSNKKINFPTSELSLGKGDSKQLSVGVKNQNEGQLNFNIVITYIDGENMQVVNSGEAVPGEADIGRFIWNKNTQTLDSTDANAYPIKFIAGKTSGTYIFKVAIMAGDVEYASKDFFINVI